MKIYVANPLYDAVFKYMMEDERIAKTLLSALLQKTVIAVEMRRHEYPNISRDAISMFRVDFAATVLEDDGSKKTDSDRIAENLAGDGDFTLPPIPGYAV